MGSETDLTKEFSNKSEPTQGTMREHQSALEAEKRQRLILDNLPEVRRIASRIHVRLPTHVLFEDILHSGVLGLIDALAKFDPTKKVPLLPYAQVRIRGAILDSLRALDWSPRSLRRDARRIEQARNELIAELGRVPSEPEIAAHLSLQLDKYQHILAQVYSLTVGELQNKLEFDSEEKEAVEPSHITKEDPFELCARAEDIRMVTVAIGRLSQKERRVLALYYFEERTMKEIGGALGLGQSRISQIIGRALDRLRACLQEAKGTPLSR
jgi:RNA polymerase sigma factor FliA